MDDRELELDAADTSSSANQEVRKNIPLKLKSAGRGRGRGRGRKKSTGAGRGRKKKIEPEEEEKETSLQGPVDQVPDMHHHVDDFRDFEPMEVKPTGPPEPTKLNWDHKVNLIGEKVVDPLIHCCEKCTLPILIYGRMLPCRHVFCFDCAKQTDKTCPRCRENVARIEQSALGTVFVCTFGGSKHGSGGCRRTYLSQRDLQAHINHRHLKENAEHGQQESNRQPHSEAIVFRRAEDPRRSLDDPRAQRMEDPRSQPHPAPGVHTQGLGRIQGVSQAAPSTDTYSIPVMSTRGSNLISVPIQDETRREYGRPSEPPAPYHHQQPQSVMPFDGHTHFSQGPPMGGAVVSPQYSTPGQPQPVSYSGPPMNHPGAPSIHHGGPPPRWAGDRPLNSPFNQAGGHSPNMTWSGQPSRGPPPIRPPTSTAPMHVPRGQYYQ